MNVGEVWKKCLESIREQIPSQHFDTWFKPIVLAGINETSLELEVPNRFFLEWLKDHYLAVINEAIKKASQREYSVIWRVGKTSAQRTPHVPKPSPAQAAAIAERVLTNTGLNPK